MKRLHFVIEHDNKALTSLLPEILLSVTSSGMSTAPTTGRFVGAGRNPHCGDVSRLYGRAVVAGEGDHRLG